MIPAITIVPPPPPEPIVVIGSAGQTIQIDGPDTRTYPDTVTTRTFAAGVTTSCVREMARCRPNTSDLRRILAARGVSAEGIAHTESQVLAMLAAEDAAWRRYEAAAAEAERACDVVLDVTQDETRVRWVARVTYAATGRPVPRDADEGGTHARQEQAEMEARARAERTGRTILVVER